MTKRIFTGAIAALVATTLPVGAAQTTRPVAGGAAAPAFRVTRSSLAPAATFTITQTLAPKGGDKLVRVYKVQVKGNKARLDYDDPSLGTVRYLANDKGFFFYTPGNKSAMKQTIKGGVEEALKTAFAQVKDQLVGAKKTGVATVSGQPTEVYQNPKNGTTVYMGTRPGFRLPVKTVQTNIGGSTMLVVSDIKLNPVISDALFALPAGTQIMDSGNGGLPGAPGSLR